MPRLERHFWRIDSVLPSLYWVSNYDKSTFQNKKTNSDVMIFEMSPSVMSDRRYCQEWQLTADCKLNQISKALWTFIWSETVCDFGCKLLALNSVSIRFVFSLRKDTSSCAVCTCFPSECVLIKPGNWVSIQYVGSGAFFRGSGKTPWSVVCAQQQRRPSQDPQVRMSRSLKAALKSSTFCDSQRNYRFCSPITPLHIYTYAHIRK